MLKRRERAAGQQSRNQYLVATKRLTHNRTRLYHERQKSDFLSQPASHEKIFMAMKLGQLGFLTGYAKPLSYLEAVIRTTPNI